MISYGLKALESYLYINHCPSNGIKDLKIGQRVAFWFEDVQTWYPGTINGLKKQITKRNNICALFEVDGSEAEICASNSNYEKHWVILKESTVVEVSDSELEVKSKKRRASSSDTRKAKKQKTTKRKNAKTVETIVFEDSGEESDSGEDVLLPAVEI